jgi:rubredoxin
MIFFLYKNAIYLVRFVHNNSAVLVQIRFVKRLTQQNTISHILYHCIVCSYIYYENVNQNPKLEGQNGGYYWEHLAASFSYR